MTDEELKALREKWAEKGRLAEILVRNGDLSGRGWKDTARDGLAIIDAALEARRELKAQVDSRDAQHSLLGAAKRLVEKERDSAVAALATAREELDQRVAERTTMLGREATLRALALGEAINLVREWEAHDAQQAVRFAASAILKRLRALSALPSALVAVKVETLERVKAALLAEERMAEGFAVEEELYDARAKAEALRAAALAALSESP